MSTAAPRQVHLLFLLVTLVLTGLVAGQRAEASITCFSNAAVCNVTGEFSVSLGWDPSPSTPTIDHYRVEISWDGGVFEQNPSWTDISPMDSSVTIYAVVGHYFEIRALACDARNTCSQPSSESYAIAFYAAGDPDSATAAFPGSGGDETDYVNDPEPVEAGSMFFFERWSSQKSESSENQQWVTGDFDGDTRVDIARVYFLEDQVNIDSHLSTGRVFDLHQWVDEEEESFSNSQQWFSGDFNGDGFDDIGKVFGDNNQARIDIHLSTGNGFQQASTWMERNGAFHSKQKWLIGDFNGDGRDDLACAFEDNGKASINVLLSNGSRFSKSRWTTQRGTFQDRQQWFAGDFNGDGRDDLGKVFDINGQIAIGLHPSSGSSFGVKRWISNAGTYSQRHKWVVGEFNGDGHDDLIKIFEDQQQVSIEAYPSTGASFAREPWATRQGKFEDNQNWLAGDYNMDGTDDLAVIKNEFGKIFIDIYR